jgi:hypothetical protein
MLKARRVVVNASRVRNRQRFAHAVRANDTRRAGSRWTRSKIPPLQAVRVRMTAPPEQTCFGYARSGAAIHLESRSPETRRRAAARERSPRKRASAILAMSDGAAPERRSLPKKFFPEKAKLRHRLAPPRHLGLDRAEQALRQMRGYTQGSSLSSHASAILPSPLPALHQPLEHARPIPYWTKATELLASASCGARTTKHKTSSRIDSQKRPIYRAQKTLARI